MMAAELQQVRQATAQCEAEALIARQRTEKYAHYYRVQADHFKRLAADTRFPAIHASRLRIATIYKRLAELAESAAERPEPGGTIIHQRQRATDHAQSAPIATDDGAAASRGGLKDQLARALETQIARQRLQLTNEQRQIASAALVKLSRTLCDITAALSCDTREKLRRSGAQEGSL